MATKLKVNMYDASGELAQMSVGVADNTPIDDPDVLSFLDALEDVTCAKLDTYSVTESDDDEVGAIDDEGDYTIEDKLELTFASEGRYLKYLLPAPDGIVFDDDGELADPEETGMAAVITAFETHGKSPGGAAIEFVRARRRRVKTQSEF